MKPYNHIYGFLLRWTLLKWGLLHVRIHHIIDTDKTPFLHSHPFFYISFVYSGWYTEKVLTKTGELMEIKRKTFSIAFRRPGTYHRITQTSRGGCKTLFISFGKYEWSLRRHPEVRPTKHWTPPQKYGVYRRTILGQDLWCKYNGMWYVGHVNKERAKSEFRPSIHQCVEWRRR